MAKKKTTPIPENARTFVDFEIKTRSYDWRTSDRFNSDDDDSDKWKATTWVAGTRTQVRFLQFLGVKDGETCDLAIPNAEPVALLCIRSKNRQFWRYILSDGDYYYDLERNYGEYNVQNPPWNHKDWSILPKSRRRRLDIVHQAVIKAVIPWATENTFNGEKCQPKTKTTSPKTPLLSESIKKPVKTV